VTTIELPAGTEFNPEPFAEGLRRGGLIATVVRPDLIRAYLPPSQDASVFQVEHWLRGGTIEAKYTDGALLITYHQPHGRILASSVFLGVLACSAFATTLVSKLLIALGIASASALSQYRSARRWRQLPQLARGIAAVDPTSLPESGSERPSNERPG
jgi:hypothetical protein